MLIDTHCHIHESNYPHDPADTLHRAHEAGVSEVIVVGTSEQSSEEAISFAHQHEHVYASVGVHPHDTKDGYQSIHTISPAGHAVFLREISYSNSKFIVRACFAIN